MGKNSQLNQMSKKDILNSLLMQQNQSSATMNRLIVALAQAAKISPEEFAKFFVDSKAGQEYADKLNSAIDATILEQQKSSTPAKTEEHTHE